MNGKSGASTAFQPSASLRTRNSIVEPAWRLAAMAFSILYGAVLSSIPDDQFKDFSNYLVYAEHSLAITAGYWLGGPLRMLANEPVWLLLNAGLGAVMPPEAVVRSIIFFSAFSVSWLVLKRGPRHAVWLMVFLLLPQVVKNHLIHLRQGLAIAIFLWGWFAPARWLRWVLIGLAPFIHASFFFILAIAGVARLMTSLRLGPGIRAIVFLAVAVFLGVGLGWLAAQLGARQAQEYEFTMTQVSGLGFAFWLLIAVLWALEGGRYLKAHAFEMGLIVFYLGTYWLVEVTARIFESGLLLVLLAGLTLTGWRRQGFLVTMLLFGSSAWLLRLGQPALGFGIE